MSFPTFSVSNAYLEDSADLIRSRSVPWEGYQRASLITDKDLELVRRYDEEMQHRKDTILKNEGKVYVELFVNLLQKLVRVDTVQYLLVVLDDMLIRNSENIVHFYSLSSIEPTLPYGAFLKCLAKEDQFVNLKSAKILSHLIACTSRIPNVPIDDFFKWIHASLEQNDVNVLDIVVQCLQSVLKFTEYRNSFYANERSMSKLSDLLRVKNSTPQMLYQVVFCFWLLTFEPEIAAELNKKYDILPALVDIAKSAMKEKLIRVVVATWKNLIEKAIKPNLAAMLVCKMLNVSETLAGRKYTDPDILEDIEFIKNELSINFQNMSTFDEYASEIKSGHLEWSPSHQSEMFWRQNAIKLNDNDHELLRALALILSSSCDTVVLAVAAHDIGQYVKFYPQGRKFVDTTGAKQRVMELMTYDNPEVRYQALIAVQKYMAHIG